MSSNNGTTPGTSSTTGYTMVGDVITLSLTASEDLQTPVMTILGQGATENDAADFDAATWDGTYTTLVTDTEGNVAISISITDIAGNTASTTATTNVNNVIIFDRTAPSLDNPLSDIASRLENAPDDIISITGGPVFSDTYALSYSGSDTDINTPLNYSVSGTDVTIDYNSPGIGTQSVTVTATDLAGNTTDDVFDVTVNASAVTYEITGTETVVEDDLTPIRTFTVTRSGNTYYESTVDFALTGEASDAGDFTAIAGTAGITGLTGTITFPSNAGGTSTASDTQTITYEITDDVIVEGNETIIATISNPVADDDGLAIADGTYGSGTGTINTATATKTIDDDDQLRVSIADVTQAEGNGDNTLTFEVTITGESDEGVRVTAVLDPQTATLLDDGEGNGLADTDWVNPGNNAITFAAGTSILTQTFNVTIKGDEVVEDDETFNADLISLRRASDDLAFPSDMDVAFSDANAVATLTNDDQAVITIVTAADTEFVEGAAGGASNSAQFAVRIDGQIDQAVALRYTAEQIGSASAPAVAGDDFVVPSGANDDIDFDGILVDAASEQIGLVELIDENLVELDEAFRFTLFSIQAGGKDVIFTGSASQISVDAVIDNDDQAVVELEFEESSVFVSSGFDVDEGAGDGDGSGTITGNYRVTLSNPVDAAITIDYTTGDVTAVENDGAVVGDNDYDQTNNTLTFVAEDQEETFTVTINKDDVVELDESFNITLDNIVTDRWVKFETEAGEEAGTSATSTTDATAINNDDDAILSLSTTATIAEAVGTQSYTLTLDQEVDANVVVDYQTGNGTNVTALENAIAGGSATLDDYVAIGNTPVTFLPGEVSKMFNVTIHDDDVVELAQDFEVIINDLNNNTRDVSLEDEDAGATPAVLTKVTEITDNDQAVISINDLSDITEGDDAVYTVSIANSKVIDTEITLTYTVDGAGLATGVIAGDYDNTTDNGTFTIAALTNSDAAAITIGTVDEGNNLVEPDETLEVTLAYSHASGTRDIILDTDAADIEGRVIVLNDDQFTVSIVQTPTTIGEAVGTQDYVVSLSNPVQETVTIEVLWSSAELEATDDYSLTTAFDGNNSNPATLSFTGTTSAAAAAQTDTYTFTWVADALVEDDESFTLTLQNILDGNIPDDDSDIAAGPNNAVTTDIIDDDAATVAVDVVTISSTSPNNDEGDAATKNFTFNLVLDNSLEGTVTAEYTTAPATTNPDDYTEISAGSVSIGPGAGNYPVTVTVSGDQVVELDEDFALTLVPDVSNYDDKNERDISNNATATDDATIVNDDQAVISFVGDRTVNEADGTVTFDVTLTGQVDVGVTVDYVIANGSAPATDGTNGADDLTDNGSGTLTFAASGTSEVETVSITLTNDLIIEQNETFTITLSNIQATGRDVIFTGGAANLSNTVTITDNDSGSFTISSEANANEGADGTVTFTVTFSGDAGTTHADEAITINYSLDGGSTAIEGNSGIFDFTDATSGSVVFFDGNTDATQTFDVTINDDIIVEDDETIVYNLAETPSSYEDIADIVVSSSDTYTIQNVDLTDITIANSLTPSVNEDGATTVDFVVTSTNPVDVAYTVTYTIAGLDLTGEDEAEADDYSIVGTLNFDAGTTTNQTQTIAVTLVDDAIVELDEEFTVTLTDIDDNIDGTDNARDADLSGQTTASGLILNDDQAIATINDISAFDEDATNLVYTVTLNAQVDAAVTVTYTVGGDVEIAGTAFPDYGTVAPLEGSGVVFSALSAVNATQTITIPINEDVLVEADEEITVTLAAPSSGSRNVIINADGTEIGTSTINNDDSSEITISGSTTASEDSPSVTYTISQSNPVDQAVSVDLVYNSTEVESGDLDYTDATAFDGGSTTTKTFTFPFETNTAQDYAFVFTDDDLVEESEAYTITLSNIDVIDDVTIGAANAVTTDIADNDQLTISLLDQTATVTEGDAGTTNIEFEIKLDHDVEGSVTVAYTTANGTALVEEGATVGDNDYNATTSTIDVSSMADDTYIIQIPVNGDVIVERTETFDFSLTGISNFGERSVQFVGAAGSLTNTATITNNDVTELYIAETAISANEGNTGDGITFQVLTITTDLVIDADINVAVQDLSTGDITLGATDFSVGISFDLIAGNTTVQVPVIHNVDNVVERDETATIALDGINQGSLSAAAFAEYDTYISDDDATSGDADGFDDEATVTLINDDEVTFTFADATIDGQGFNESDDDGSTDAPTYVLTSSHAIEDYGSETFDISYIIDLDPATGSGEGASETNDFVDANADGDGDVLTGVITVNTFTVGATHQVTLQAADDNLVELDEHFNLSVTAIDTDLNSLGRMARFALSDGAVADETSLGFNGVITDLDVAVLTMSVTPGGLSSVPETDAGTTDISFDVNLSAPVDGTLVVTYFSDNGDTQVNGATTEDNDYISTTGDLTWTFDGTLDGNDNDPQTITISVNGDYKVEADEIVSAFIQDLEIDGAFVTGSNDWVEEVSIATPTVDGTIENDDVALIVLGDAIENNLEGDDIGGEGVSKFQASLIDAGDGSPASVDRTVFVNYNTIDGVALSSSTATPGDFTSANGTFEFSAGSSTSQVIDVTYVADLLPEEDEDFEVQLTTVSVEETVSVLDDDVRSVTVTAVSGEDRGTGEILNDDRPYFSVTASDGTEGTTNVQFTVRLDGDISSSAPGDNVTVDYTISNGTAESGASAATGDFDNTTLSGILTFARTDTPTGTDGPVGNYFTQVITVPVFDDGLSESQEDLSITIDNPVETAYSELEDEVASLSATANIVDNDPIPVVISADQTVAENVGTATVSISFTGTITKDLTVDYSITTSGAVVTDDFTLNAMFTGTHTFSATSAAPVTNGTYDIDLGIVDNAIVEGDETITVAITGVTTTMTTNLTGNQSSTVTIDDDDTAVLSISNFSVGEGDVNATVIVTSTAQIDRDVTVELTAFETGDATDADADGSVLVGGNDFDAVTSQLVTISSTGTTGSFDIPINEDLIVDGNEDFHISIDNLLVGGAVATADNTDVGIDPGSTGSSVYVTIRDNDVSVISIGDESVIESNGTISVPITLTRAIDENIIINRETVDGTAIAGTDYTALALSNITITAGDIADNVIVDIDNDDSGLVEGQEAFTVELSLVSGFIQGNVTSSHDISIETEDVLNPDVSSGTVTINDDDQAVITIADISGTETALNGAQTVAISSDAPVDLDVTFNLNTVVGTAIDTDIAGNDVTDEEDYVAISNQPITIDAGTLVPNSTVEVTINDDNLVEADESFTLRLSSLNATTIGRNVIFSGSGSNLDATVSITEDDASIISIADVDQTATADDESNSMNFVISITNPIDEDIELTVNTIIGTAAEGDDFTAISNASYIIPASTFSASLNTQQVIINSDNLVEADETFTIQLSGLSPTSGKDVQFSTLTSSVNATGIIEDDDEAQITFSTTPVTGTEGDGETVTFTIQMSNPVDQVVVFNASTVLSGLAGDAEVSDLIGVTDQQVIFSIGDNLDKTVTVNLVNNEIVEGDETFDLSLTSLSIPTGRAVAFYDTTPAVQTSISSTATIGDDDSAELSIADVEVNEDDGTATITVTSSAEIDEDVTVNISSGDDSAIDGSDYTAIAGATTVTITAGLTSNTFDITLIDDVIVEGTESFDVTISNDDVTNDDNHNVLLGVAVDATVTIDDDDVTTLSILGDDADEGSDITIEVTSDLAFDTDVTIDLASVGVSATATDDYGVVAGTVTILEGATSGTVAVTTVDDNIVDGEETFTGTISNLSVGVAGGYNASIADTEGTFTINDLDVATFTLSGVTATEGGNASVTITTDVVLDEDVEVTVTYTDGTAVVTDDYSDAVTSGSISSGDLAGTLVIAIPNTAGTNGEVVEGMETFTVDVSGFTVTNDASHSVVESGGAASATVTIDDNDVTTLSISDASATEGDNMTFTVSSALEFDEDVTVLISTADNIAIAGLTEDYTALSGTTVTLTEGTLSGSVTTSTIENTIVEGTEDFSATISALSVGPVGTDGYNATIATATGTFTIDDDDVTTLSILGDDADEGSDITIEVTSDLAFDTDVTIDLASVGVSATATDDYGVVAGTVTILEGATSGTVAVTTVDDNIVDGEETFTGTISNLSVGVAGGYNASIADTEGTFTINDLDEATFTLSDVTATEGGNASVTITTDVVLDEDVEIAVTYSDGTAIVTDDYSDAVTSGSISSGDLTGTLVIAIPNTAGTNGEVVEGTETFTVDVSGFTVTNDASHSVVESGGAASATVTIDDNDVTTLSISDASATEGDNMTFTVSSALEFDADVTVLISTADNIAIAGLTEDYTALSGTTVTLTEGTLSGSVTTSTVENTIVEGTEDFSATISALSVGPVGTDGYNATIATATGTFTIDDNDAASISVSGVTVNEGDGTATITISSDLVADEDITVTLSTSDDTASDGTDYTSSTTPVVIIAGTTIVTSDVTILTDDVVEATESFDISIASLTVTNDASHNATIGTSSSSVTISDDDAAVINITGVTINEADATATLEVTIDNAVDEEITLIASSGDGTATLVSGVATSTDDYTAINSVVTFSVASTTTQEVTVSVLDDSKVELDENFIVSLGTLTLTGDRNVTIGTSEAIVNILNDDSAVISINDVTINEESGQAVLSISMDNPVDTDITFSGRTVTVSDGATSDVDFDRISATSYTILEGDRTVDNVVIEIIDDNIVEGDEALEFELSALGSSSRAVTFEGGAGTETSFVTITNTDDATISLADQTVSEADNSISFTLSMDAPVDESITITANTSTASGNATSGDDFTSLINQQFTFPSGNNTDLTITVVVEDDDIAEALETFDVLLSNIVIGTGAVRPVDFATNGDSATGTITDDDSATITINDVSETEGLSGATDFVFTVTLTGKVDEQVDVSYQTRNITSDSDDLVEVAASSTVSFASSTVSPQTETITISVNGDLRVEEDEQFEVFLSATNIVGKDVTISDDAGLGTIENDDVLPEIVVPSAAIEITEASVTNELVRTIAVNNLQTTGIWNIVGGNQGDVFGFRDINELIISDDSNLDRESVDAYSLRVTVSDGVNVSDEATFEITITDENDTAPVVTAGQVFTVSDDAANGTVVGMVAFTDEDITGTVGDFEVVTGSLEGVFELNFNNGEITVVDTEELDFEKQTSYTFSVQVSDGVADSEAASITINVDDTNDAPELISVEDVNEVDDFDEDPTTLDFIETTSAGTAVATFTTTDMDVDDTHTYELVGGDGAEGNSLFRIEGDQLVVASILDADDSPVSIRVRSTDNYPDNPLSVEAVFSVMLVDDPSLGLDEFFNVFTPSVNDGFNDVWNIPGLSFFEDAEVKITTKDGDLVFESKGYEVAFDGTQNGAGVQILPRGEYVYNIKLNDGTGREYDGSFTLL